MVDKKAKALRVDLNTVLAADLLEIKNYYGIQSDSDMIRFLIREHKKELITKEDYKILKDSNKTAYILQENGNYNKIDVNEIKINTNEFDVDLIRFNINPLSLAYILKGIFSRKQILLLFEQDFMNKHFDNFFNFITENTFEYNISYTSEKNYTNNEERYKNFIILKGDNIIRNIDKIIQKKKIHVEKDIVQKFFSETDPRFSLLIVKNEIKKAYLISKKMIGFIKKNGNRIITKDIADYLKDNFPFKIDIKYLEFLVEIIKNYFKIDIPEIYNTLSDFFFN